MITRIFIMMALLLSTAINASESTLATLQPANDAVTVKQLSEQLEELTAKLEVVSNENTELKNSIVPNIEEVQQQFTQINTKNAEIAQYLKKQNLDYQSLEKRDVDLKLFMDSPNKPAWINFWAVIISIGGSIGLSLYFLHRTLKRETDKQLSQILIDANKRKEEHLELLGAQGKQNDDLLKNQVQLARNEQKERHKVVIDELRQKWINTFRDEASNYLRLATQLLYFYEVEKDILPIVKSFKSAEGNCARFRTEFREENKGLPKILTEDNNSKYRELMEIERDLRQEFETIKPTYIELKELQAELIEKKVKIGFMLNPDKGANNLNDKAFDNEILDCISHINDLFISEQRTYQVFTNKHTIEKQLTEFQRIVPLMLKAEWDRVQRK